MKRGKRQIGLLLLAMLLISWALPLAVQAETVQPKPHHDGGYSIPISRDAAVPRAEIIRPLPFGSTVFVGESWFAASATVVGGSNIRSLTWSVSELNGNILDRADTVYFEYADNTDCAQFIYEPKLADVGKTLALSVWPTGYPEAASTDSVFFHVEAQPTVKIQASPIPTEAGEQVTVTATISGYPTGYEGATINCEWDLMTSIELPDEMRNQTFSAASGQPVTSTITFIVPTADQLSASGWLDTSILMSSTFDVRGNKSRRFHLNLSTFRFVRLNPFVSGNISTVFVNPHEMGLF